jgi:hypothetical protein
VPNTKQTVDVAALAASWITDGPGLSGWLDRNQFVSFSQPAAIQEAVFETLEPRILMSASDPATGSEIVDMQWGDVTTHVITNEWVERFDGPQTKIDPLAMNLLEYGFTGDNQACVTAADGEPLNSLEMDDILADAEDQLLMTL